MKDIHNKNIITYNPVTQETYKTPEIIVPTTQRTTQSQRFFLHNHATSLLNEEILHSNMK